MREASVIESVVETDNVVQARAESRLLAGASRLAQSANADASARAIVLVFAIVSLIAGTGYALLMFPLHTPDEAAHLLRAWATSEMTCRGANPTPISTAVTEMQQMFAPHVEEYPYSQRIAQNALHHVFESKPVDMEPSSEANFSGNLYSCVPYVPAATVLWTGRHLHAGVLPVFYAGRLMNVIVYTALAGAAIWLLPAFRLVLAVVGLLPMTLHQVGSYSADSLTLALSFLFFAFCMYLSFGSIPEVRIKHCAALIVLGVLLALCKFNAWMLLLAVLIPARRFSNRRYRVAFLAALVLLPSGLVMAWQVHNRGNVDSFQQARLREAHVDMTANTRSLTQEPGLFFRTFATTVRHNLPIITHMFIGRLGLLSITLPSWLVSGMMGLLLAALLIHDEGHVALGIPHRALLILISIASFVSVYALLWTFETTTTALQQARSGNGVVGGFQGRYLLPFAPLLLVGLSWSRIRLTRFALIVVVLLITAAHATALGIVYETYHFVAPPSRFEGQLIRRPGSTPEDGKVYVVSEGKRYWVLDGSWITRYGYKPSDIRSISSEDLSRIPGRSAITSNMIENGFVLRLPVETAAERYDGKVVHFPWLDKRYLITGRKKREILQRAWLTSHGYTTHELVAISSEELEGIPQGEPITQDDDPPRPAGKDQ